MVSMVNIEALRQTIKEICWPTSPLTVEELTELIDRLEDAEKRAQKWESVFGHLGTPDEVGNEWHALTERLKEAEEDGLEQARLNGMGSEREAALMAKLEAAQKKISSWQPIESLSVEGRKMFVVRAFNVANGFTDGKPYTTDPWCVWRNEDGSFARWPHHFAPTHWMPLPESPC